MGYSQDLKLRVLSFLKEGGSQVEASKRFSISTKTIYLWMKQPEGHQPKKPGPKHSRKFDENLLKEEVIANPGILLRELAEPRGVSINTISVALRRLGFARRKNGLIYQKAN